MKPLVELSDLLVEMVDQGFIRPDHLDDSHRFWVAYRSTIVALRTAPVMVGALSNVVVAQCTVELERELAPDHAGLIAQTWATMCGECWAEGDLRRGSLCTHRILVGAN